MLNLSLPIAVLPNIYRYIISTGVYTPPPWYVPFPVSASYVALQTYQLKISFPTIGTVELRRFVISHVATQLIASWEDFSTLFAFKQFGFLCKFTV